MEEEDSSIDGDLEDFLRQNGIDSWNIPSIANSNDKFGMQEGVVYGDSDEVDPSELSSYHNIAKHAGSSEGAPIIMPSAHKVMQMLDENGFESYRLNAGDISSDHKISVFVVDNWASTIVQCLEEMTVRLDAQNQAVKDVSLTTRQAEVSHEALETRVRVLQDKLLEAERKVKASEAKANRIEEENIKSTKVKKSDDGDSKRLIRGLEEKVEESERRVRQRDLEIERLKDKLRHLVEKEKETNTRHREVLTNAKASPDTSFSSSNTSYTSTSASPSKSSRYTGSSASPSKSSRAVTATASVARTSQRSKMLPVPPVVHDMIEALEAQRDGVEKRNAELEAQLYDLQLELRDRQNGDSRYGSKPIPSATTSTTTRSVTERSETENSESSYTTETARSMYDKIKEQSRKIEQLSKKCDSYKKETYEAVHAQEQMRARNDELREEIENFRLELEARPSARQWADKQRELQDAENKLHDMVMMRGEAAELAAWRKHLSTSDRIKVDRRNHELGLWLLDSLPKAVTKEVLQTVCRELDVSDISEIQPSLAKLKAVVKAVPRMERFISQVCDYLFERDRQIRDLGGRGLSGRDRPTMEDVLPVLQSWWVDLQNNFNLSSFQNKILSEIRRREKLLAQEQGSILHMEDYQEQWPEKEKAAAKAIELVRDMVDFQVEVFHHKKSFRSAEEFIRDQPEAMVNRQMAHIQYLFGIQQLEGLLPRMNQVYLFVEEMRNFMTSAKLSLGLAGSTSDAITINEIQRVISVWEAEMKS